MSHAFQRRSPSPKSHPQQSRSTIFESSSPDSQLTSSSLQDGQASPAKSTPGSGSPTSDMPNCPDSASSAVAEEPQGKPPILDRLGHVLQGRPELVDLVDHAAFLGIVRRPLGVVPGLVEGDVDVVP